MSYYYFFVFVFVLFFSLRLKLVFDLRLLYYIKLAWTGLVGIPLIDIYVYVSVCVVELLSFVRASV